MAQSSTAAAAAGALYSVLLRILSFSLSQLTIRFVDPTTLGKASIRLELICSTTVLFLGREGFRLSLMRVADSANDDNKHLKSSRVNNVAWLSVPTSLFLTLIALGFHMHTYRGQVSAGEKDELDDYRLAGILYCVATAIEIISEPCMIVCLRTIDVKTRAKAEAFASIGKAMSCVLLLSFHDRKHHASSFGLAQCVYAIILTIVLYVEKRGCLEWPVMIGSGPMSLFTKIKTSFDLSVLRLSILFSTQSIFKHVLTEGDRIVLTALVGTYDSGVYAMASSYGGMASRLIFQPLEENGRLLFSNQHASIIQAKEEKREVGQLVDNLEWTYCVLVKFVLYIGFIFAVFGSNYTSVLLRLLAGERWGSNKEASTALSAFCIYTALMALNGMTEAFVYGVAESGLEVGSLAVAHGLIGIVFYVTAPLLVYNGSDYGIGGTVGLVMANGLCMALRSIYSLHFASSHFAKYRNSMKESNESTRVGKRLPALDFMRKLLPRTPILVVFIVSYNLMNRSRIWFCNEGRIAHPPLLSTEIASHIGVGITCFIVTGTLVYFLEKDFGRSLRAMVSRSSGDKAKVE